MQQIIVNNTRRLIILTASVARREGDLTIGNRSKKLYLQPGANSVDKDILDLMDRKYIEAHVAANNLTFPGEEYATKKVAMKELEIELPKEEKPVKKARKKKDKKEETLAPSNDFDDISLDD